MTKTYSHITSAERLVIESMLIQGHENLEIAQRIGVDGGSISRERSRNTVCGQRYDAAVADGLCVARRRKACAGKLKLGADFSTPLGRTVVEGLRCRWSPQQIAGRLRRMPKVEQAADELPSVSHETIYCALYAMPKGELRKELIGLLRKSHKTRMPRARGQARFTGIRDMTPIHERPVEVEDRVVPGHWEGDLIKGARNASGVGTLAERTSRFLILAKLEDCSAASVLESFTRRLKTVPAELRKTLTYDQGTEMASHSLLSQQVQIAVYFCDPHSPWQRGTNENTNGLIREYLPKHTDLSQISHQELTAIETSLNNRPRRILGYRTPTEVYEELKLRHTSKVALQA